MGRDRDAFRRLEREGWERTASRYDSVWASLTTLFVDPLLAAVGVGPGMRLLDVACGPGYAAAAARRLGAAALGLDFSREMIQEARSKHHGIEFREGDAENLPFEPRSFDAVVMNFGLLHLASPEKALAEACRVLGPGRRFGFTVWAKPEEHILAKIVQQAIEAHADLAVSVPEGPHYFRYCDHDACRRELVEAGFSEGSMTFDTVGSTWTVPTPIFLFEAERDAGVRTAAFLARQSPERLAAIGEAVARGVERYAAGSGFAIPVAANIVTASTR